MKTFLTIAGSDPSGGAGIQADMKTAAALGLYSMSVITAVTVQNTNGVSDVFYIPPETVRAQAEAVFSDIFPDCVKIGMCVNEDIISVIADILNKYKPKNVVLDTVLVSSSGKTLLSPTAARLMESALFPLSDVITPNVPEARYLTGLHIEDEHGMERAAETLYTKYGCAVMLKGGHLNGCDLFYDGHAHFYKHAIIDNKNTHGTGCTLSSALACSLALCGAADRAAAEAVDYTTGAIADGMNIGHGAGPLNHLYRFMKDRQDF